MSTTLIEENNGVVFTKFNSELRPWRLYTTNIRHEPSLIKDTIYLAYSNGTTSFNATDNTLIIEAVGSDINFYTTDFKTNFHNEVSFKDNVGINTITPTDKLHVIGDLSANGTISASGTISTSGTISAGGTVSANGVILNSDDRVKHNEKPILTGLEIIRQLEPELYDKTREILSFDLTGVIDKEYKVEAGFIAQKILAINDISFCVSGGDYEDVFGNNVAIPYNLNYNNLFVYNVAAVKELDVLVKAQSITIAALIKRIDELESR